MLPQGFVGPSAFLPSLNSARIKFRRSTKEVLRMGFGLRARNLLGRFAVQIGKPTQPSIQEFCYFDEFPEFVDPVDYWNKTHERGNAGFVGVPSRKSE